MRPTLRHGLLAAALLVGLAGLARLGGGARSFGTSEAPRTPPVPGPRPVPARPDGPLAGLAVYLSAGHGLLLHRVHHDGEPISWGTQRDRTHGIVEDEWTAAFVADHLAPALEEAGAVVFALRERDRNPAAHVADDEAGPCDLYGSEGWLEDERAEAGLHHRLLTGGSAAWSIPRLEPGRWLAYARWVEAPDQDDQAIYTLVAGDRVVETVVDQTAHGGVWYPLGEVSVNVPTPAEVFLTGSGAGRLSADAIRIGGGTFSVTLPWSGEVRQAPYFDVAMAHQLERLGGPLDLAEYDCGTTVSDMRLRAHWASTVWPAGEEAVYLSLHTNAGGGRGLIVFYGIDRTPPTAARPESRRLASLLERSVFEAVSADDPGYRSGGARPGDYSEISPVHAALPSALLELGFHDDRQDAARLRTAAFREGAARGIVDGLRAWRAGAPGGEDLPLGPPGAPDPEDGAAWVRPE